jgi:quercetin dioxygenase-like cupin family protein
MQFQSTSQPTTTVLDQSGEQRSAVITQPGEGVAVTAFGNEIRFQLTSEQNGGALTVGMATVPPGTRVPPHVQSREEELFLIVEGEYRFWIDGELKDVSAGGLAYMPRGVPHTFEVVGERPGRHWVLSMPGGFDRFFARCAEVFAVPGPPDFARLAAINAEFGIKLV